MIVCLYLSFAIPLLDDNQDKLNSFEDLWHARMCANCEYHEEAPNWEIEKDGGHYSSRADDQEIKSQKDDDLEYGDYIDFGSDEEEAHVNIEDKRRKESNLNSIFHGTQEERLANIRATNPEFKCQQPECENVNAFTRPHDLIRHEDSVHFLKEKLSCPRVGCEKKKFSRKDALVRHEKVLHSN